MNLLCLQVTQAGFLPGSPDVSSESVLVACLDHLTLHCARHPGNDDVISVHDTIGQRVCAFDVNDDARVLYATNCYMETVAKVRSFFSWSFNLVVCLDVRQHQHK